MAVPYDAVVVSHGSFPEADAVLRSIFRQESPPENVLVVENGTSDASWRYLQELSARQVNVLGPRTRLRASRTPNLGYSDGVRKGLEAATRDWVLLVNPDCILEVDAAALLLEHAVPGMGVLSGALRDPHSSVALDVSYGLVSRVTGRTRVSRRLLEEPLVIDKVPAWPRAIPIYPGAVALINRAIALDLGCFPPSLFLYYDELDTVVRMSRSGLIVRVLEDVLGTHARHSTTRSPGLTEPSSVELFHAARSAMVVARALGRPTVITWLLARMIRSALLLPRRSLAAAHVRGLMSGLRLGAPS